MKVWGIVGLQLQPKQWAKKEAVKTANQIESRTQPELVLNQASKSTIVRGALISVLEGGAMVETAMVGREGVVGAFAGLGPWNAFTRAVVQIPGIAGVIPTSCFQSAVGQSVRIRNLILRYKEGLLAQVQQTAACNALHSLEARLARWLLQASDRLDDQQLPLTQDCLAQMLGVRRTTVTLMAGKLQEDNLITYHRGHITLVDRAGLERVACECYRTIRRRTDVSLPPTLVRTAEV